MTPENWIYPTAFNPCLLECKMNGEKDISCTLHFPGKHIRRKSVNLSFTGYMFEQDTTTVFECDLATPRKVGEKPYLLVTSIYKIKGETLTHIRRGILFEFAKLLLEDAMFYDATHEDNDYVLKVPPLFHVNEIAGVFNYVIPNFYAISFGVRFFKDKPLSSNRVKGIIASIETIG